jgi:excinuclease ABC subunit C
LRGETLLTRAGRQLTLANGQEAVCFAHPFRRGFPVAENAGRESFLSRQRRASDALIPQASILAPCARRPVDQLQLQDNIAADRAAARAAVPVCPGVYAWLNSDRTIVYVGKAKSLRHRLLGYFATETADPKMARIRRNSSLLAWEPISHELLALVREQELIDRCRPPWNVEGKPERRQPGFVCLSRGVAPRIVFANSVSPRADLAIGPIAGRGNLRDAVAALNHVFGLRDCPDRTRMRFSNQLMLFDGGTAAGCLRFELSSCPGPCAGACSRQEYHANVERATRFLAGRDRSVLGELQVAMERAADNCAFERAAVLRDQLAHLQWLDARLRQWRSARRRLHGILDLPGFDHQRHWMVVERGVPVRCLNGGTGGVRVGRPAHNTRDAHNLGDTAAIAGPTPGDESCENGPLPWDSLSMNWFLLLASWLRRYPREFSMRAAPVVPGGLPSPRPMPAETIRRYSRAS